MAIDFTPKFFSRPTAGASTQMAALGGATHLPNEDAEHKKYSMKHGVPKRQSSPWSNAFSTEHQRYHDIDWTNKEVITKDGARIKFGAALSDAGEIADNSKSNETE